MSWGSTRILGERVNPRMKTDSLPVIPPEVKGVWGMILGPISHFLTDSVFGRLGWNDSLDVRHQCSKAFQTLVTFHYANWLKTEY